MCNCKDKCKCSDDPCKCKDGKNAFTKTTASFIQPACGENVTINVQDSEWMAPGQPIIINGNQYEVIGFVGSSPIIKNLCGPNNVAPGTEVLAKSHVAPNGFNGIGSQSGGCNCPECDLVVSFEPDEEGDKNIIRANVSNGQAPYTYKWEEAFGPYKTLSIEAGSTTDTIYLELNNPAIPIITEGGVTFLYQGLFKLTVTDANGCKKEAYYLSQILGTNNSESIK